MKLKHLLRASFGLYCYSLSLHAQNFSSDEENCCPWAKSKWFNVHNVTGNGIGFNKGYTTAELFLSSPSPKWCFVVPFVDLRGHYINGGNYAVNAGIGSRFFISDQCRALGANVYYDYRHTKRKNFNQIGLGFEFINSIWELRANGYLPIRSKKTKAFDTQFSHFFGNSVFIQSKYQFAYKGISLEAGVHPYQIGKFDFFFGAGPYYFKGKIGKPAIGGIGRLAVRYGQYASVEVADSYDQIFHNRIQGIFSISIPFGPKAKAPRQTTKCCCDDQLLLQQWVYDAPKRQELIVLNIEKRTTEALDSSSDLPLNFVFVNNTSSSNGTFESPYHSFAQAEAATGPNQIIYVFPGDGTTNGMNAGIVLQNGQKLLSSGVAHTFNTQNGSVTIPAQTANLPNITGPGTVVTLANNNEVSGFSISGGNPSISGNFVGITGSANINNNTITASSGPSISILPVNSAIDVIIDNNTISNATGNAIVCNYTNSTGTATVQNSKLSYCNSIGIEMNNIASTVVDNVLANTLTVMGSHPIFIVANNLSTVNSFVNGNTLYDLFHTANTAYNSIYVQALNGGEHITQINNNQINCGYGSTTHGIFAEVTGLVPAAMIVNINHNQVDGAASALVVHTDVNSPGVIAGQIFNNLFKNSFPSSESGVFTYKVGAFTLATEGPGQINISVFGNLINDSGEFNEGIGLEIFGSSETAQVQLSFSKNIIDVCDGSSINLEGSSAFTLINLDTNVIKENEPLAGLPATVFYQPTFGSYFFIVNSNVLLDNRHRSFNFTPQSPLVGACMIITNNSTGAPLVIDNNIGASISLEEPSNNNVGLSTIGTINFVPTGFCSSHF